MQMTNYMELLTDPLRLLLFMAIPVVLAETIAITELHVLFTRDLRGAVRRVNRWAGIAAGAYFAGVFVYLMQTAVVPLTESGQWRGPIDMVAVGFYLLGVVPLGGIALLDAGLLGRRAGERQKLKLHAVLVGVFLVTAHVAMIAGMLNPELAGWTAPAAHAH
ncbi:MAG TPA: DUF6803 family protein [Azospirillaceae bacterium]|nr:DUF6803 family protein [Azospirillaceae bacterium]